MGGSAAVQGTDSLFQAERENSSRQTPALQFTDLDSVPASHGHTHSAPQFHSHIRHLTYKPHCGQATWLLAPLLCHSGRCGSVTEGGSPTGENP